MDNSVNLPNFNNESEINYEKIDYESALKKTISNAVNAIHKKTIERRSKQVASAISFATPSQSPIYAELINEALLEKMGLGTMKEVQRSSEKRAVLLEKIATTHELLADFFDSEKNPFLEKINKEGKSQLAKEIFHLVTDPNYIVENIIGLGGSEDDLNIRLASSYLPAVLQVTRIFKQKNDQLREVVAAELSNVKQQIESRYPNLSADDKNKMMQNYIEGNIVPRYPNSNWRDCDESGLPRHFIGIPRAKILNAWSAAAEINGMNSDLLSANSRAIFDLYGEYIHKFFPDVGEYMTFSIPTIDQFVDTGVYNEVHRFLKEVVTNNDYPDKEVRQEFIAEILPMIQRAWKHNVNSSNTENFSEVSDEEKQQYLKAALAYIVCHVVEAGFNNLQHISDLNTCTPKAVIKFGGSGEIKFNKFQNAIVKRFQGENKNIIKLNTSGNKGIAKPIFATIQTGGNPAPYYDIKNYGDRTHSDVTIADIKARVNQIHLEILRNNQQLDSNEVNNQIAQEVYNYYMKADPRGKLVQDIMLQEKVGVSLPNYIDFISKWQPQYDYYEAVKN